MLRRNILIFHLGALGDFLLTWPLALALSRIHPQSRVIYVTHAQKGALAEEALRIESTDIEAGWHHLYGSPASLPPTPAKLLAGSHSIYSFIAAPADPWAQHVKQLAPDADLCCLDSKPSNPNQHATDQLMSQLSTRPAVLESLRQMIRSISDNGLRRRTTTGRTIVIHPGSGSADKCWPSSRFLELTHRLRAAGHTVRVLLGEVELERWPSARIDAFANIAEVARPQSLIELLRTLADAALYIGNDSGPSHLAAMLGLPTLCLFGPTNPTLWRPLGPQVRILHRMPLTSLTVDEVHGHLPLTPS